MKKNLKLFIMSFVLMFLLIIKVNAVEVSDEVTLKSCIETTGNTCKLSNDIVLNSDLIIEKNITITLDLNGHSITPISTLSLNRGLISIIHGGTLIVNDSVGTGKIAAGPNVYSAVSVTKKGNVDITKTATLIVNGGTLEGNTAGINGSGNADRINTSITINGGTVKGTSTDSLGIFHPQDGYLEVNGGTISGTTGIEMRAGTLVVNGGTIQGTGTTFSVEPNGSGSTTKGVGIAIAQHTTDKKIDVTISGGIIKGYKSLNESNPQKNSNVEEDIALNIEGGTFETINGGTVAVESENLKEFVSGGTFSSNVDLTYLVTDIKMKEVNGSFVANNYYLIYIDEDIKNGTVTAVEKAYSGDLVKLDIKPDKGYKVSKIEILDHLDRSVEVKDTSFTMPASPVMIKVTFEKEEAVPNTGDGIITFIVISLISLMAAGFSVNKLRKNV